MSALNRARAQAMLHTPAPETENKDEQAQTVAAEQKDEQTVKGTVKSVDGKKVTITVGEKNLKLQKGDKVSVVLVKDAEGKEQVKSVKLLPAEVQGEKAQEQKDSENVQEQTVETAQGAVEE